MLAPGPVVAQEPLALDESCTVTVGNQTARVQPDGAFVIENIAVFRSRLTGLAPQLYRVRATCLRDGQMITGQSDFFSLEPGQTTFIADVLPGELDPIPVEIDASAPVDLLTEGASTAIRVTATLPDGTQEDVTSRAAGTTYLATNPTLLSVGDDGRVTNISSATTPQTVTVAVLHEGLVAGVEILAVGPSDDLDGDGLPNEYEELFGFDPLRPDADEDPDGDGLTNLEEFEVGTLPDDPDTDRDGLPDGSDLDPLAPDENPPTLILTSPLEDRLFEGQTVPLSLEAEDDGRLERVELRVNGVPAEELQPISATETLLTVPYAAQVIDLEALAVDALGNTSTVRRTLPVVPDPGTTVRGLVLDPDGRPIEGAEVGLRLGGFRVELFDFGSPLTTFPDLSGRTPDAVLPLSAVNLRNPGGALSPDAFGAGLAPDFAARITGHVRVQPREDIFTFLLGSDGGARLFLGPRIRASVLGDGTFTVDGDSFVRLLHGNVPIQVEYFEGVGDSELQLSSGLSFREPLRVVRSPVFGEGELTFVTTTGHDGAFEVSGVPTILGPLRARARAEVDASVGIEDSRPVEPVPGGVSEIGTLDVLPRARVLVFGDSPTRGQLVAQLEDLGHQVLGPQDTLPLDLSSFDTLWFKGVSDPLTADEVASLVEYVSAGGGLFVGGEAPLGPSLEQLLDALVVAGGITVARQPSVEEPFRFEPGALRDAALVPHPLDTWVAFVAEVVGGVAGPNVLATGPGEVPVAAVWACDDLEGGQGRLALMTDGFTHGNHQVVENLQRFLQRGCP